MKTKKHPRNATPTQVCSSLFCLCDPESPFESNASEAQWVRQDLPKLLPLLNLSSTCYVISGERPADPMLLDRLLDELASFLEENRFLQISLRPVHPFAGDDVDEWIEAYLRFLRACKPFQEEGYREQIIARLRVFPVLFMSDADAAATARPFLKFLRDSFFLPSILVPHPSLEEISMLAEGKEEPPWVRVYVTDVPAFDEQRTLPLLHAHEIIDRLIEDDAEAILEDDVPCLDSLILDAGGTVRSCIEAEGRQLSAVGGGTGVFNPSSAKISCATGSDRFVHLDCLLPTMELVGMSYRVNRQAASAWHRLCDRIAGRLVRKGLYDQAVTVWESSARACEHESTPSQLRLQIALCHYGKGDLEQAMEVLKEAQKGAPLSADIRYYMGLCEFGWKDYIEAADRFQEAIDLGLPHPLHVEAQYYRGLSHYHLEEYDQALDPLAQAEQAGMGGSPLPFYQALCLLGKEKPQEALPYLQEALSRGPSKEDLFHILFYIAHTYKEMEDFPNALAYCAKAEEIQPDNYELWNLTGFCHFKQRNHDAAITCFEKAIEIHPKSGIDYANIGSNLRDKGDAKGAIAMYKKALSLDPTIEFARDSLERLLEKGKARTK